MSALNYLGRNDRRSETFIINGLQEQALLKRLLQGRDDQLYDTISGTRHARDTIAPETRGVSGNTVVMPFWN